MLEETHLELLRDFPPVAIRTRLAWEAVVTVAPRLDLGAGTYGHHFIVPITGGAFQGGPDRAGFHGKVVPGGADRQLLRNDGIKELEALYELQVHDGTVITIKNEVITDPDVKPDRYAASRIKVFAPEGRWAWLNRRLFLGSLQSLQPNPGYVVVRGWEVLVNSQS